jgi:hypothetical protein
MIYLNSNPKLTLTNEEYDFKSPFANPNGMRTSFRKINKIYKFYSQ